MKNNEDENINKEFNLNQTFCESDLDYSVAEHLVSGLLHLEKMTNSCFWIFDYFCNNFYYISQNTDFFAEKDRKTVLENGYDYFIHNTHPNDVLYLLSIHKTTWNFFNQFADRKQITEYKISYIIRLKNTEGIYIPVSQTVKPIALDKKGNIWLAMGLFEVVKNQFDYLPYIQNTVTGEKTELNEIALSKKKFTAPKLSKREKELLQLIVKNQTQTEIAEIMHITPDTLRSHRKNLYRKLQASDKNEAIKNAYYLGIIHS